MKKTYLQRLFAMTLASAMIMGTLSGCGNNATETDSTQTTDNASGTGTTDNTSGNTGTDAAGATGSASGQESGAVGMEGWEPFAENVTLTIPVYDRGAAGVPDVTNNYWTKWIQENFGDVYNITVEFEPITRTDVLTSYNMLATVGELPTILMEYDFDKLAEWGDKGYLIEYDLDEFARIAPTYYERMVELDQIKYTELNGSRYFVLAERPYFNATYTSITWYRQDWLEELGYTEWPATWDEQKEIYQRLIDEGYCQYPLGGEMINGVGSDKNYEFRTYPQDELEWAMYGDYQIPALSTDAQREWLRRENEKYNLGFFNPEYYVRDAETNKADFVSGNMFQLWGYTSANVDFLTAFYEQNPNGKIGMFITKDAVVDEKYGSVNAFRPWDPFGMMIGFSSQATEDEVKAAMMYMEWMTQEDVLFTMQWGVEGKNFEYGEDGNPVSLAEADPEYTQGFSNSKDYWCVTIESRSLGSVEADMAAVAPAGLPVDYTQDIIDNYYGLVKVYEKGYANSDCKFAVVIKASSELQQSLCELYAEYRDQLVTCPPDQFDALYDELSQKYLDAGYQEVVNERREAYEAGYTTKLE